MSWFTRGADAAVEARKKMGSMFLPEFWLKKDESAEVIFLDAEPFNFWRHAVKIRGKLKNYTCRGKGCPLCAGDDPRYLSVYRVLDMRTWLDKQGKKHQGEERYYMVGSRAAPSLERLNAKKMLLHHVVEITRAGEGTATVYSFLPMGKSPTAVPKGKLDPMKDLLPKTVEELQTVAELLGFNSVDQGEPEEEAPSRSYMSDQPDEAAAVEEDAVEVVEESEETPAEVEAVEEEEEEAPPVNPLRRRR